MSKRKILVVFELPKTLLLSQPKGFSKSLTPKPVSGSYNLIERPGAVSLIRNLLNSPKKWEVGIWTCLRTEISNQMISFLLEKEMQKLLFVNCTRILDTTSVTKQPDELFAVQKNLDKLGEQFREYDPTNIVVVSPEHNKIPGFVG